MNPVTLNHEVTSRPANGRLRRILPALLVAVVAVGIAFGGYVLLKAKTRPERLLVALRTVAMDGRVGAWWVGDGKASARLCDEVSKHLSRLGLVPVESGSPDVVKLLPPTTDDAALLRAAESLDAGFVLTGDWVVTRSLPVSGSPYTDFNFELRFYLLDAETGERVEMPGYPLPGWAMSESQDKALLDSAEYVGTRLFSPVAYALANHARLSPYDKQAGQVPTSRAALAAKLEPLFEQARRRDTAVKNLAQRQREALDEWNMQDLSPKAREQVGRFQDEEYFLGSTPEGIVLFEKPRSLEMLAGEYGWVLVEGQERLALADEAGLNRKPLFSAYNFFSYPGVSADGKYAAAVVDNHSWSKSLYRVDLSTGAADELLTSRNDYYSTPRLSPDGSRIAYWFRTCYDCADSLRIVDVATRIETELIPTGFSFASMPSFSPDGRTLYLALRASPGSASFLIAIDAASGRRTPLEGDWTPCEARSDGFYDAQLSADGVWLWTLESCDGTRYVGRWNLSKAAYTRVLAGEFDDLRVHPSGSRVATRVFGWEETRDDARHDSEVAVVDAETKQLHLLTINSVDDHVMGWSRDGATLYFHESGPGSVDEEHCNRIFRVKP